MAQTHVGSLNEHILPCRVLDSWYVKQKSATPQLLQQLIGQSLHVMDIELVIIVASIMLEVWQHTFAADVWSNKSHRKDEKYLIQKVDIS